MNPIARSALATALLVTLPVWSNGQSVETTDTPAVINPNVTFTSTDTIWLTHDFGPNEIVPEPPSTAPLGISLATTIELDEPDPLALPVPMPPVAINPGTTLTLRPSTTRWSAVTDVVWFKNGIPMAPDSAASDGSLVLPAVTATDSGSYRATLTGDDAATGTVIAHVLVNHGVNQPLANLSTRATIGPANPHVIVGISIAERINADHRPKTLLVRAVGETLADHGVTQPLPDPLLQIFDSAGTEITPVHYFSQIVYEDGTTPESRYFAEVANAAQSVGAFPVPVPGPEGPPIGDYSDLVNLNAGVYTIMVSSAGGQTGDVLVEVYSVAD